MKRALARLLGCLATALCLLPAAHAQSDYPNRPITLVNPYAPGGPADTLARELAARLKERLGQPVVVENKAGSAAMVGTGYVARAKPDGYTLLMGTSPGIVVGPLIERTTYDGLKDFDFIGLVANQPVVLVANAKLGIDNLQDLVERARKQPGKFNFASAGTGGPTHLAGEMLRRRANIDITHVPYKGAAPALQDLLGGQVELGMLSVSPALPFIKDGRLKPLAYTGMRRSSLLPEVPTMSEAGVENWNEISTWYALVAPRGTPAVIIQKLSAALTAINAEPAHRQFLAQQDGSIENMTPAEVTAFAQKDKAAMTELLGALEMLVK
ncbi:MAG: tripartite tricarboxylate transporter substrate binding protein [Pigmentiphaga sp.]|uniref:Bug family tripartite tricarboxylate transporter substrate binding protein n=1 Tax=Pigmentiphaga sp. TaxID=1977564 RepID=UPI0029A2E46C|nr:tripartite tricarboxylate transporter substrate binding protein [Pigmentiphaga sp.]MDX3907008.1 tripartite tricarboxylate transporter substrate binding protein [Pigmentiphaga sp.]